MAVWQLLLFAAGTALLLMEAASPGLGLPSAGGFLCLLLAFLPECMQGLPAYVPLLGLVSFGLFLLDSRFPGLGPLAWLGLLGLCACLFLCERSAAHLALALGSAALLAVPSVAWIIARLPSSKKMKEMSLNETLQGNGLETQKKLETEGVAVTDLHPGGLVRLGESQVNATARCGFIERGARVRVLRMRNGEALVDELPPAHKGHPL